MMRNIGTFFIIDPPHPIDSNSTNELSTKNGPPGFSPNGPNIG